MRIGQVAFDCGDTGWRAGCKDIAADRRQIGVEPQHELPRGLDPLAHDRRHQPQQHRFFFEQAQDPAGFHAGDELVVVRPVGFARGGKALVNGRRAQLGQLLEEAMAQAVARGRCQISGRARLDRGPKQRRGLLDHRQQQLFERARLALAM